MRLSFIYRNIRKISTVQRSAQAALRTVKAQHTATPRAANPTTSMASQPSLSIPGQSFGRCDEITDLVGKTSELSSMRTGTSARGLTWMSSELSVEVKSIVPFSLSSSPRSDDFGLRRR